VGIHRLNHAVLWVRDAARSAAFYCDVLGFTPVDAYKGIPGAVFLRAADSTNDHDLGLFSIGDVAPTPRHRSVAGLYHLAWEVNTLTDFVAIAERLTERSALVGSTDHGTTKSLYGKDPDGLEFEIVWIIPLALLTDADIPGSRPLDLAAELERFGMDEQSGTGISRP
jgi:catechol-2,3-dioxygenase